MLCAGFMGLCCLEGSFPLQAQSASALPWPRVSLQGVLQEVLGEGDQAGGSACRRVLRVCAHGWNIRCRATRKVWLRFETKFLPPLPHQTSVNLKEKSPASPFSRGHAGGLRTSK